MNFREYFTPIDIYLFEAATIITKAAGKVDPTQLDPRSGKPYKSVDRLNQILEIKKKEVEGGESPEDLWATYSCTKRFGIKYVAEDGGTPIGLYGYPLDYVIKHNLFEVPYGGDRRYLHVFKVKGDESIISMKVGENEIKDDIDIISKNTTTATYNFVKEKAELVFELFKKMLNDRDLDYDIKNFISNRIFYPIKDAISYNDEEESDLETVLQEKIEEIKQFLNESKSLQSKFVINLNNSNIRSHVIKTLGFGEGASTFYDKWSDEINILELPINSSQNSYNLSDQFKQFIKFLNEKIKDPAVGQIVRLKKEIGYSRYGEIIEKNSNGYKIKIPIKNVDNWTNALQMPGDVVDVGKDDIVVYDDNNFGFTKPIYVYSDQPSEANEYKADLLDLAKDFENKDSITKGELSKILNNPRFSRSSDSPLESLVSASLQQNPKFNKVLKFLEKKLLNFIKEIKVQRKKIAESIEAPFKEQLKKICEEYDLDWPEILTLTLRGMKRGSKMSTSGNFIYKATANIARKIYEKTKDTKKIRKWVLWTNVLRKIGVEGFADRHHTGSIHEGEKTQGVFFEPRKMNLIATLVINNGAHDCDNPNKYKKIKRSSSQYYSRKELGIVGRYVAEILLNLSIFHSNFRSFYDVLLLNPKDNEKEIINYINKFLILFSPLVKEIKKMDEKDFEKIQNIDFGFEIIKKCLIIFKSTSSLPEINSQIVDRLKNVSSIIEQSGILEYINSGDSNIVSTDVVKQIKPNIQINRGYSTIAKKITTVLERLAVNINNFYRTTDSSSILTTSSQNYLVLINNFIETMKNINEKDKQLRSLKYDVPWVKSAEFSNVNKKISEIKYVFIRGTDIEREWHIAMQSTDPKYKQRARIILDKINQIKSCVKPRVGNLDGGEYPAAAAVDYHFWCDQNLST